MEKQSPNVILQKEWLRFRTHFGVCSKTEHSPVIRNFGLQSFHVYKFGPFNLIDISKLACIY